ncbi:hypothetical protein Vretimale_10916 [Volvox reticuliferus]|uniref:Uncharacterized protein n=1 Tax=Volvox reticuliferus TaxID=1737510 RepID=A0A8J4GGN0_9CHLO|nr:hypothetical protein Vretimale_10916 [Volvox reticuliferus]
MPKQRNSFLVTTGDRTIDGWVTQAQAQAPAFGAPFTFGTDLRFTRKPLLHLTAPQLRSLAYLDPAAAAAQTALRNPQNAPVVRARIVRHGSLDGSGFLNATVAPPQAQPQQQARPRRRWRHSFHANSQNMPPSTAIAVPPSAAEVPTAAASFPGNLSVAQRMVPAPPPMNATVSRAPVVLPHGRRVTKATGLVLREWGSLYPQAWAPAGADGGEVLPLQSFRTVTGPLPTAVALESMLVVERQDAADWRRASAAATVATKIGPTAQRRKAKGHPAGCRCPACTSLVAMYYSESEDSEDDTPGPGQYDVAGASGTVGRNGPAFTIRGRTAPPPSATFINPEAAKVPGPGAYNVPRPFTDGPAFTIKGRPRGPSTLPDDLPGPGEYYDSRKTTIREGPAFTLAGKAKRKFETDAPGPGAYSVEGPSKTGPAISIAGRPRSRAPEPTPGPQHYQHGRALSPGRDGPAYTIGTRQDPKPDTDVPAPGEYDLPTAWRTGPAVSFAGKPVPKPDPEPSPGPGQYHMPPRPGTGLPAFTFGARPQEPGPGDDLPGPGTYYRPIGTDGPAFTIASRPASPGPGQRDDEPLPGPGAYDPQPGGGAGPSSPSGPAYTFGARPPERSPPPSPGPGTYRPEETLAGVLPGGNGPAYTLGTRPLSKDQPDSPGPGDYHPSDPALSTGPAFTMAGRPVERDPRADLPAPGEYEIGIRPSDGPAFTIRGRPVEEKQPVSPGPGEYNSPAPCAGPAYTIAGRPSSPGAISPDPNEEFPGPGAYDILQQLPTGPAYTLRGRPEERSPPPSPGPGDYTKHVGPRGPAFSIRGKPVEPEPPLPFVGPGAYDPEKTLSSAPAFTLQGRPREQERPPSPGPGEYDAYGSDAHRGPAWTMVGRSGDQGGADGPAPGSYDLPATPRGPAYTMRSRAPEPSQERSGPGPGEYSAPSSPTGPAYSFQSRPTPQEAPESPGPGDYQQLNAGRSGPAFTIKGRHDNGPPADPDIPGPGMYGNPDPEALGHSGPAYTLRSRLASRTEEGPGPGEYDSPGSPAGPAYTIAGRPASPGAPASPGPGAYSPTRRPDGPAFSIAPKVNAAETDPTPAPGDYGTADRAPLGPAWSLSQRLPTEPPNDGPGPGEYYCPPSAGGPAFTMGSKLENRRRKKRSQLAPEPGQYWSPPPPSGPAWTIGARSPRPTIYKPEAGPGDYDDRLDMHTGSAFTLRPRTSSSPPDPVPGPGTYNDAKPFPNPLGTVISRPRAHTERDPVYITDMGGPYDDTMTPRRSPARPSRKVTFHQDTLFRDSLEPTYSGRVRFEESTVSGPGGAVVPSPRARGRVVPPVTYLAPSPPRESGISAGTTYPGYNVRGTKDQESRPAKAAPRSQQQQQGQQQRQQHRWMGVSNIPSSRFQQQQQQQEIDNLPPQNQAVQMEHRAGGHRPASRERQRQQQQPQLQRGAGKGATAAGPEAAASTSSGAEPRDMELDRAVQMYRRVALEKRYLAAVGAAADGEVGRDGGGSSGNGEGWVAAAAAGDGGGRVVAGVRSSPQQRPQSQLHKQQAGRIGATTAPKHRAATPTPGRRPPAPASAGAGGGGGGRSGGGSSLLTRPVTYPQQQHYMAELAAHQAASERERKGKGTPATTPMRPPAQPQPQPAPQVASAAELAVVARAQQAAGRQALWTAAAEGRTAPVYRRLVAARCSFSSRSSVYGGPWGVRVDTRGCWQTCKSSSWISRW